MGLGKANTMAAASSPLIEDLAAGTNINNRRCGRFYGARAAVQAWAANAGMKRWVGLGVIADNIINIGRAMGKQDAP